MNSRIFHRAVIGGFEFEARADEEGPYIACKKGGGSVCLGVCQLNKISPDFSRHGQHGWYIVKYTNEALIDLSRFSDGQARVVAEEFGINIWEPRQGANASEAAFYQGRAWESLKVWVREHPALAKKFNLLPQSHYYLPHWYERALGLLPIVEYQPR